MGVPQTWAPHTGAEGPDARAKGTVAEKSPQLLCPPGLSPPRPPARHPRSSGTWFIGPRGFEAGLLGSFSGALGF